MGCWRLYTFVLARLGPLHLGCNKEVAALLRWLLTQVSLYTESMLLVTCSILLWTCIQPTSIFTAFPTIHGPSQGSEPPVAGASLELECTVSGVPVPVVTWFKDGQQLTLSANNVTISIRNDGVSILRIHTTTEGSNRYMCIGTNAAGSVNSSILQVDITSGNF